MANTRTASRIGQRWYEKRRCPPGRRLSHLLRKGPVGGQPPGLWTMCGISGYAGADLREFLPAMCGALRHRGPDDSGTWSDREAGVGLGHRRLAIIDLTPTGHQPMCSDDKQIWLVYNGEVYNFNELRATLVAKGIKFRGTSDTEVVLRLYQEEGIEGLRQLNGIFAFAIWDARSRELFLARDQVGCKP